jgi:carboxypeptidase Q
VLYTNEENGGRGGNAYLEAHRAELSQHVFAIETDSGTYRPEGFGLSDKAPPQARANLIELAKLLAGIRADGIAANGGGSDISPLMKEGVIGGSLDVDGLHYFEIHHTEADTLDKVNPQDLALCVAAMAVMVYTVAEMPGSLKE